VAQLHISAFRVLPGWPIFSRRFGDLGLAAARLPNGPHKVLSWAERYLERLPRGRAVLFKWASVTARAGLEGRSADDTLRSFAAELRMPWGGFQRTRRRACQIIAAELTRDRVPIFYL
jgi:hypothetical protein